MSTPEASIALSRGFRIEADDRQWRLFHKDRRRKGRDGRYEPIALGFYASLGAALRAYADRRLRDTRAEGLHDLEAEAAAIEEELRPIMRRLEAIFAVTDGGPA